VVTSIFLRLLLVGRSIPATIHICRPSSAFGWFRAAFIGGWLALLAACIISGVPNGDEGMVLTSTIAPVILLIILSAPEHPSANASPSTATEPAPNAA
jgi:hypothetical protein